MARHAPQAAQTEAVKQLFSSVYPFAGDPEEDRIDYLIDQYYDAQADPTYCSYTWEQATTSMILQRQLPFSTWLYA